MAVEGHDFSFKGILLGVAFCVAAHIIMVPTGLETWAHGIGDQLSGLFNGAAADPTGAVAAGIEPHIH
ncbi:MAG: hypothetical protein KDJ35_06250 [Alphaproteobacteria bacterium]|nr:hypothetical protein [Alphaproteobacteria bacterium]